MGMTALPEFNGDIVAYIYALLSGIDRQTWIIIISVIAAIGIFRIVIAGIKKALFIVVIALIVTYGATVANNIVDAIGISYKDNYIIINNDYVSNERIRVDTIDRITIADTEGDDMRITLEITNGKSFEYDYDDKYYDAATNIIKRLPVYVDVK